MINILIRNFKPGWFVVNRGYMVHRRKFLVIIKIMEERNLLPIKKCIGDICMYFIETPEKLMSIREIINSK